MIWRVADRTRALCLALLLAGCVQSATVSPPPLVLEDGRDARSVLMLFENVVAGSSAVDQIQLAWAGDSSAGIVLPPFSVEEDERARVHVWLYSESLAELGLTPGRVEVFGRVEETCRADGNDVALLEPVPRPGSAYFVELEGRSASAWTPTKEEVVSTLETLHLTRRVPNPCVAFDARYGTFPDTCVPGLGCGRRTLFVEPDGTDLALIGRVQSQTPVPGLSPLRTGFLYRIGRDGTVELFHTDTSSPAEAGVAIEHELLVLRANGRFECARPDGGECVLEPPPPIATSSHTYSALALAGSDLLAVRDDGGIWRYDGRDWSETRTPGASACDLVAACEVSGLAACDLICRPSLAVRGTDAFVAFPHLAAAYYLDAGGLSPAELPPDELVPDDPLSVGLTETYAVVGTSRGRLLLEVEPKVWRKVFALGRQEIYAIAELDQGVLFAAEDGALGQYHPQYGACAETVLPFARITHIVPMGRGFLVAGMRRGTSTSDFAWLERSSTPGDPCIGFGLSVTRE